MSQTLWNLSKEIPMKRINMQYNYVLVRGILIFLSLEEMFLRLKASKRKHKYQLKWSCKALDIPELFDSSVQMMITGNSNSNSMQTGNE